MGNSKHSLKKGIYIVSISLLFFSQITYYMKFYEVFNLFELFFSLLIAYYFVGALYFKIEKYKAIEFFLTSIINAIIFNILRIINSEPKIFIHLVIFTILQLTFRIILLKTFKEKRRTIIIGEGKKRKKALKLLKEETSSIYIGTIGNVENSLGSEKDLLRVIKNYKIENIIITKEKLSKEISEELIELKIDGLRIVEYHNFVEMMLGKIDVKKINNKWIINSTGFNILNDELQLRVKRTIDIILSLILLLLFSPIFLLFSLLIKLTSRGPILFKQKRVGFKNKEFEIIKFRSMKLHDHKEHSKYAQEKDTRITKIGLFMRKTRVDELPQLFLILKGDMSFIGPRPEWNILCYEYIRELEEKYGIGKYYKIRHSIKPGVTGWAQVMYPYGENLADTVAKLEYDLFYIKNQSLTMDLIILLKTLKTVIFGKGK